MTKKPIPIIYLPWWDNTSNCKACHSKLTFTSDCQKHCTNCFIFYVGCRYCLTTNIIFGLTDKSQCKKCEKTYNIIINTVTGNDDLDDFLANQIVDNLGITEFTSNIKNIDKYFFPLEICNPIYQKYIRQEQSEMMKWIPYSQVTNVQEIAKGGYGIIYQADWLNNGTVILKKFRNPQDISKYFLNEVNILITVLSIYEIIDF